MGITELEDSNHCEADTRLILEADKLDAPVIVHATDTDVLVLMVHEFPTQVFNQKWQMKIGHERFVNIESICAKIGTEACAILPAYHSITGCDTTSFPFGIGKLKPWKKMIKLKCYSLLNNFGSTLASIGFLSRSKEFFRTVMYGGNKDECYIDTRIRMYERQKVKSSSGIIPDENSTTQHLKRSCFQAYIWHQCTQQMIDYPPLNKTWGWKEEEVGIVPVWYTCSQFPPNNNQLDTDSSDDEGAEVDDGRESNEEESTDDSDYDLNDDSDGSEDDF
ncbi:hypothetical protein GQR58_014542 [Nymphon striatum]|nr:hypothetical protein GQR58_014542 [Nymphon striatum]